MTFTTVVQSLRLSNWSGFRRELLALMFVVHKDLRFPLRFQRLRERRNINRQEIK